MTKVRNACILLVAITIISMLSFFVISKRDTAKDGMQQAIVVASPHPVDFMKPLINEFESQTGIRVDIVECGTSEAISKIEDGEAVDVLWGGSILSVGSYGDLFLPYTTENAGNFFTEYVQVDDGITCFTDVPSILIVNTDLVGDIRIEGYEDLLNPALAGKIAFASPARSSSSFEHLTNMLYAMGGSDPERGWDYVEKFCGQLGGRLLAGSSEVYQGVSGGKFVVGLTFEEAALTMLKAGKHVKLVYMEEGVVSTPDGIYISKKCANPDAARAFVDFMTAYDTQKYISTDLGRRSVREDVESSSMVQPKEELNILVVDKDKVVSSRQQWIDKFMSIYGEGEDE